jgi:hypothetical protein
MYTPNFPGCAFVVTDRGKLVRIYSRDPQKSKMFAFKASKTYGNRPKFAHLTPYKLSMKVCLQCHGSIDKFA